MSDMTPVQSSNIHSVGHDGEALLVRFRGRDGGEGRLYRYPTAGQEHHRALTTAPSAGAYFFAHVRNSHAGERVEG